jgi:hypothetical protein
VGISHQPVRRDMMAVFNLVPAFHGRRTRCGRCWRARLIST